MKNRFALIFFIIIHASTLLVAQNGSRGAKPKQPNIIFIFTDDLGYGDVGVFFQNQRRKANNRSEPFTSTPNIDKLAASGATMPQHYCAAPVCAPARASLMLGVHQGHANIRNNQFDKALENNHTIASTLRTVGYKTAIFGKWGLQGLDHPGPDWPAHPLNRGFDYYMGMIRHVDGHEHYPKEGLYRGAKQVWENKTEIAGKLDKCYTTDLWTAATKKWITDNQKGSMANKPFFIYLAYETPHAVLELPTQAYPKGGGLKGGVQWVGEPGRMINTASGKIDSYIHPEYAKATYDHDKNPSTPEVEWPDVYKRFATSVRRLDDATGDLIQLLKDLDIYDNTIVVFSSDNGPSIESYLKEEYEANFFDSYGPFDGIKRDVWEGGVRVPTIATWPGHIPANSVVSTPSGVHDWLPTFLDAAGAPPPARSDGVSLIPSLTKKGKQKSSTVYIEYWHNQSTPDFPEFDPSHRKRRRTQMQMIRMGDTLGIRYDIKSHEDNFEIYDIAKDPKQTNNLAGRPEISRIQNRMKDRVLQVRRPDTSAARPYDKELVAATAARTTKPGVVWKSFNGKFPWLPEVTGMVASATGTAQQPQIGLTNRGNNGATVFTGYLKIPEDGEYTFYISTKATALLRLHDATVIDADYNYNSGTEQSGSIMLKAGLHPFRLYYASKAGNPAPINLKWEGKGISKQSIPANIFYYD